MTALTPTLLQTAAQVVTGCTGNDSLSNEAANNVTIYGSSVNDVIFNSANDVTMDGGSGNDSLVTN